MKCPKCASENSNAEALICELCGELLRPKAPSASASSAPAARLTPKGSVNHVRIAGSSVNIPQCCCCCLSPECFAKRPSMAERRGLATKTFTTWEFPYCGDCAEHAHAWYRAWLIGGCCGFAAFILCFTNKGRAATAGEITFAVVVGSVVAPLLWFVFKKAKGPRCATEADAVTVGPAPDDSFVFRFANGGYGSLFSECNS